MVQAFHANIVFPNKQEAVLNKMTPDGHILESETYVGGHVEALESGVFRANIPCRFRMVWWFSSIRLSWMRKILVTGPRSISKFDPESWSDDDSCNYWGREDSVGFCDKLQRSWLMSFLISFSLFWFKICDDVTEKLSVLRDCPNRLESPIIYHLDVAAMYPNIILTNRLQVCNRVLWSPIG